jgi:hypothetical protein
MSFKEFENIENLILSADSTGVSSSYQREILLEFLDKQSRKSVAKENPFVFFYEDVISSAMDYNFQIVLGTSCYDRASDDAKNCLNICDEFYKLSSWGVSGWLQNALKFIDNIVLHYIQGVLNEKPKSIPHVGIEKARYIHLSEKKGAISTAGYELKELYDLRNELEHRTIIYPDGRQELVTPKRNKVRQKVIKIYPNALKLILKSYKELSQ